MHSNNLVNLLHEKRKFPPLKEISKQAHIKSEEDYQRLYEYSINSPNAFWLDQANSLSWIKKPTQGLHYHWDGSNNHVEHTWFADGFLNVSYNCLDRHLDHNKTAIIWQGDEDHETSKLTYGDLLKQVCKFANVLKSLGINKGDRVCLYMPMIPELAIAMLA